MIGTGVDGAACAVGLLRIGFDVTAFDKSSGVGGRLATRRAHDALALDRSSTVVLAIPAKQAAALLRSRRDEWAMHLQPFACRLSGR